jgi:hypothetical protein
MRTFFEYRSITTLSQALRNIANDLHINNVKQVAVDLDFLDLLREAANELEAKADLEVVKVIQEAKDELDDLHTCCHAEDALSDAEFVLDKAIHKLKGLSNAPTT